MDYKLAVVIPCWNCSKDIGAMLDCIMAQSFEDWRLYCVDDHSTDDTYEVLQRYEKRDQRIVAVQRPRDPKGAQTCRNYGFELSEGAEYVIWFDSDDLVAPWCFGQRVQFMDSHPELDFGVFKAKSFFKDIYEIEGCRLFGNECSERDDLRRMLRRTLPFVGWTNIYRRKSIEKVCLIWDEKIKSLQDSDFNIQSLLKGLQYAFASQFPIDYYYRMCQQSGSISSKIFTKSHVDSHLYFIAKLYNSLSPKQRKKYRYELDSYLIYFVNNYQSDEFAKSLNTIPLLKRRWWFLTRLLLYSRFRGRTLHLLFPVVITYSRRFDSRYWNENKTQLKKETNVIKGL